MRRPMTGLVLGLVALASVPTAQGQAESDVLPFGGAAQHGSMAGAALRAPLVGMAATPSGGGYWLVARDGGIFTFGDATFHGSTGALTLNQPIVGMAPTRTGHGYWLVARDGGIFTFGDATFHGSTGGISLRSPVTGMAADPDGDGYWLVAGDGGIFAFDAPFHGSAGDRDLGDREAMAVVVSPAGGYWIALRQARTLPRGGHRLFPDFRVVAYYGAPGNPRLGVLGTGAPDDVAARLEQQAAAYAPAGRPLLPAFELIASIATSGPGPDGDYSAPMDPATIETWLAAARRHRLLLVLDIQPGRADFLAEVQRYERFLVEPDVGVALDPEWSVRAPETPGGGTIGSTDAATINRVSDYLAGLVRDHDLPQKLLVVHQFTSGMVRDRHDVVSRPELAITFHADGFGSPEAKISKYRDLHGRPPFSAGLKLFYGLDRPLLSPEQVMALDPPPDLITYQ